MKNTQQDTQMEQLIAERRNPIAIVMFQIVLGLSIAWLIWQSFAPLLDSHH